MTGLIYSEVRTRSNSRTAFPLASPFADDVQDTVLDEYHHSDNEYGKVKQEALLTVSALLSAGG